MGTSTSGGTTQTGVGREIQLDERSRFTNVELGTGTISLGSVCGRNCEDRRDGISGN
jgi:hypothetical protein